MNFIAIDVETANTNMSSICQIGFVIYENGEITKEWSTLINPEEHFDLYNTKIHGITENDTKNSPKFPDVFPLLKKHLSNNICVCHTHFDRVSLMKTCLTYELPVIECTWLDSAKAVRRHWPSFRAKGYGLNNICKHIGYKFTHHDALEDAKAAAFILMRILTDSQTKIEDLTVELNKNLSYNHNLDKLETNQNGSLIGEVVVFTGSLITPRRDAADIAAQIGCSVSASVTKKTTLLVVGDQDVSKLNGKTKSNKHLKAEELISKGQNIRIIKESDFNSLS